MPAVDRNVKVTCENCGTSVTKKHLSRHKSCFSGGALYCPKCPNLSTKSRDDLNYHIAKKHMECADTLMFTRAILLWRSRNLCVHQTILST